MRAKTQYIKIKSENEVANAAKIEISVELAFDEPGRILRTDNESIMLEIEDVVAKHVEFCRSKPVDPDRSNMKILLCEAHSAEIVGIAGKIEEEGAADERTNFGTEVKMASENETVEDIVRESRDKYTVHKCNECTWRKSCMGRKFGDSECVNARQSINLAFGIEDGYFSGLLDRIEAAHKREVAKLRECLKDALLQRCTIRPEFKCKDCAYEKESCSKWRKALEGANRA